MTIRASRSYFFSPSMFLKAAVAIALIGCGGDDNANGAGTGGQSAAGGGAGATGIGGSNGTVSGTGTGGNATGGAGGSSAGTGGAATGGNTGTGGTARPDAGSGGGSGNSGPGGPGSGGAGGGTGGRADAGTPGTGGRADAGPDVGNQTGAGGARPDGGAPAPLSGVFMMGADITDQEPAPAAALDNLLLQMKAHGFNYVRLRTFVDPRAADGYDQNTGFDDITHTVAFGKRIKDAGMGLLVDFHYSDNWADPGKQCIPVAWQGLTTIAALSTAMHDYTKDAITQLVAGGARPDMVQIGNETTPGMLLHHCDSGGLPMAGVTPPVTGAATTAGWPNLGMLLKAGVQGVKDVDTGIVISLHIDRGNAFATTKNWIDNAVRQGVAFDAFGESCYQQFQGDPNSTANTLTGWTTTFAQLVAAYPNIKFFAAEYGPMQRQINDVLFNLPNRQGIGTFDWEPTSQGSWNAAQPSDPANTATHALFQRSGNTYTTLTDLPLYDAMKTAYAGRL
jgi:arabinogalactan endo-1,4-beta-galactosidase